MTQSSFYFIRYDFCDFSISQKAAKSAPSWGDQLEPDQKAIFWEINKNRFAGTKKNT